MFWRRKEAVEPRAERPPIVFRADDTTYQRAENIWYALGFVNDRMGAIPKIAGFLGMYREWDRLASEQSDGPAPESKTCLSG